MRTINLIVVHCSATREDKSFTEHDLDVCHRRRGFNGVGYHFYIRKNGDIKSTRPLERIGAHSRGFNRESIGICYEGGLDCMGQPKDTRTCWQKHSLRVLILTLLKDFPGCRVCGHRDLSPDLDGDGEIEPEEWIKACPCFEASKEWDKEQVSFFIYILYYQLLLVNCYWLLIKKTRTFSSPGFLHLGNASFTYREMGDQHFDSSTTKRRSESKK